VTTPGKPHCHTPGTARTGSPADGSPTGKIAAAVLHAARLSAELSYEDLAERCGVSVGVVRAGRTVRFR